MDVEQKIIQYRKYLERNPDEKKAIVVFDKLAKLPMTVELLQSTGIGKAINGLRKHEVLGDYARVLVSKWKTLVASGSSKSKTEKSDHTPSPHKASAKSERESTASSERYSKEDDVPSSSKSHHHRTLSEKSSKDKTRPHDPKATPPSGSAGKHKSHHHESRSKEKTHHAKETAKLSSSGDSHSKLSRSGGSKERHTGDRHSGSEKQKDHRSISKSSGQRSQDSGHRSQESGQRSDESGQRSQEQYASLEDSDDDDNSFKKEKDTFENKNKLKHEQHDERLKQSGSSQRSLKEEKRKHSKERHREKAQGTSDHREKTQGTSDHHRKGNEDRALQKNRETAKPSSSGLQSMNGVAPPSESNRNRSAAMGPPVGPPPKAKKRKLEEEEDVEDKEEWNEDPQQNSMSFDDFLSGDFSGVPTPKKKLKKFVAEQTAKESSKHKDKKESKHSSSSSNGKHRSSSSHSHHSKKEGSSEKRRHHKEKEKSKPSSSSSSSSSKSKSSHTHKDKSKERKEKEVITSPLLARIPGPPKPVKLSADDIMNTLPEIQTNYHPLPKVDVDNSRHKDNDNMPVVGTRMYSKGKLYSGRKQALTEVPTLYGACMQILMDNIDALEHVGGVPYDILQPVLAKCSPNQLYNLEDFNPVFVEDSDGLWEKHCKREFRGHERQDELETWRELYWRKYDERNDKLLRLTGRIAASSSVKPSGRQTMLAYIDSAPKPPRQVLRNQKRFGTAGTTKEIDPLSKLTSRGGQAPQRPVASGSDFHRGQQKQVKMVAPMMKKTLKFMSKLRR